MNERILKLAASHFPRDGEGNISATPEIITEFAELIVRECASVIHQRIGPKSALDVLEHFGVEK